MAFLIAGPFPSNHTATVSLLQVRNKANSLYRNFSISGPGVLQVFRTELPMGFYDRWVGRDVNGELFKKEEPYGTDPYTLQRLPEGLPFPVKCCWNGLLALNAAPFTKHNLRIR